MTTSPLPIMVGPAMTPPHTHRWAHGIRGRHALSDRYAGPACLGSSGWHACATGCTDAHHLILHPRIAIQAEESEIEAKYCPSCNVATVRSEGCDHIICVCGHNWNWENMEDYNDDY